MPICPNCHSKVSELLKTWPVVRPKKNGEILDCKVGIYWCDKCNEKFPLIVSKQSLKLIEVKKLKELYDKIKIADKINKEFIEKVDKLEKEKMMIEKSLILTRLENRSEYLLMEISFLKEVKKELMDIIKFLENDPFLQIVN